jgi:hypothetical protein
VTANGYIEGTELDGFLAEFVSSVNIMDVGPEVSLFFLFFLHPQMFVNVRDDSLHLYSQY